jgi:hypothetical protein
MQLEREQGKEKKTNYPVELSHYDYIHYPGCKVYVLT